MLIAAQTTHPDQMDEQQTSIPKQGARNRLTHLFKRLGENSAIFWEYWYYFLFSEKLEVIKLIFF